MFQVTKWIISVILLLENMNIEIISDIFPYIVHATPMGKPNNAHIQPLFSHTADKHPCDLKFFFLAREITLL